MLRRGGEEGIQLYTQLYTFTEMYSCVEQTGNLVVFGDKGQRENLNWQGEKKHFLTFPGNV